MKYLILLSLVVCGCTTTYTKTPYDPEEFQRVATDCTVKANQAGQPSTVFNHSFFDMCMSGQGWTVK